MEKVQLKLPDYLGHREVDGFLVFLFDDVLVSRLDVDVATNDGVDVLLNLGKKKGC